MCRAQVVVYLALVCVQCGSGLGVSVVSQGMVCLWVCINLGITGRRTHLWYRDAFGSRYKVRWVMIPGVW